MESLTPYSSSGDTTEVELKATKGPEGDLAIVLYTFQGIWAEITEITITISIDKWG